MQNPYQFRGNWAYFMHELINVNGMELVVRTGSLTSYFDEDPFVYNRISPLCLHENESASCFSSHRWFKLFYKQHILDVNHQQPKITRDPSYENIQNVQQFWPYSQFFIL